MGMTPQIPYDRRVTNAPEFSDATLTGMTALDALRRWPASRPLAALVSGPGSGRWSRRSILAEPRETRVIRVPQGIAAADARKAVDRELRQLLVPRRTPGATNDTRGVWIVSFSYDLGRIIEPSAHAARGAVDDRDWPLATLCWCPDAMVLDHATGGWTRIGNPPELASEPHDASVTVGELERTTDRTGFERAVERCVRLIHDGDLFQANIARRLSAHFSGSTRALAARAFSESGAWFGAYVECGEGRALLSMSPELFLDLDASSRRVVTRPIKGTRPQSDDASTLATSEKDGAELAMIVDLMRNDLGRVCDIGSVRVDAPRLIETHPTVHHAVAEISGRLRDDIDLVGLLGATFPPGSVTGAPKVRAMQVIDELEPVRRGPYCGATGLIASDGSCTLNVAIRTITIAGRGDHRRPGHIDGTLDYWAGCGIVAESRPADEWEESVTKTAVLLRALAATGSRE
jgi:anthranilate/para-aminobenzoate synthase component I